MYKDSFRYDKATLCQTALRSSSYFQGTCYRASFTKEDGRGKSSVLNEISFPSLSSRLRVPCCQSWGTPSTRAHFIKCHFGPHFTLWPALPMQRKQNARCSLCLLPQQRFIHYSKKKKTNSNQTSRHPFKTKYPQPGLSCHRTKCWLVFSSLLMLAYHLPAQPTPISFPFFPSLLEFEL